MYIVWNWHVNRLNPVNRVSYVPDVSAAASLLTALAWLAHAAVLSAAASELVMGRSRLAFTEPDRTRIGTPPLDERWN